MEIWKDVIGFEEYFEVSSYGRVYGKRSGKILNPTNNARGYPTIPTRISGKCFTRFVHRWVADAFVENIDNKPFVNHKDGCKVNNRSDNLEWVTNQENIDHAVENNLRNYLYGEDRPHKLKLKDVQFIRNNYKERCRIFGARALGRKFKVHHETIRRVVSGKNWT